MNSSRFLYFLTIIVACYTLRVNANERWFEVELVIFSHDNDTEQLSEKFPDTANIIDVNKARDLISSRFPQSGAEALALLPQCDALVAKDKAQATPFQYFTAPDILIDDTYELDAQLTSMIEQGNKPGVFGDDASFITTDERTNESRQENPDVNTANQTKIITQPNNELNSSIALDNTGQESVITTELTNAETVNESKNLFQTVSLLNKAAWQTGGVLNHCKQTFPSSIFTEGKILNEIQNKIYWSDIPLRLSAIENVYNRQPYLISDASLHFRKEVQKLMWRNDIKPLLHFGWRQPVKSERREKPWRIFTGKNYSREYQYSGEPVVDGSAENQLTTQVATLNDAPLNTELSPDENLSLEHHSVVSNIQNLLGKIDQGEWQVEKAQWQDKVEKWQAKQLSDSMPEQVWEFDGLFKIYLRHYLYIETEFNVRKVGKHPLQLALQEEVNQHHEKNNQLNLPIEVGYNEDVNARKAALPDSYLYAYPFKQNRRIRSGEIHYFDHPLMGIMMQVRKYTPPVAPKE
ncbi:CsiV family protein [Algibacillus agarilyticus]|uniref:CsiV family protein n=1 Tax=Algibacillus agarilyticus TaxID=2234133 RepID=UPI001300AC78|nr:CsiV family protein [Algibacillus agarilyticus]